MSWAFLTLKQKAAFTPFLGPVVIFNTATLEGLKSAFIGLYSHIDWIHCNCCFEPAAVL